MNLDMNRVQAFHKKIRSTITMLQENKDLYDNEHLYNLENAERQFMDAVNQSADDTRKLRIGIVGAVKAGKSSFLNACLFDGEDILPKACTPMTAALTIISYSEEPKAIIHYYPVDDWERIRKNAYSYTEKLDEEYNAYVASQKTKSKNDNELPNKLMSKELYEKNIYRPKASESERSCLELLNMADKHPGIEENLGKTITVDFQSMDELNPYVGADGQFTPIVSHVELQINSKDVDGLEIVDTPGFNDPVHSRSNITKQFLAKCDVVLLLSPCSQFMDENTIRLMTDNFPTEGIKRAVVIGSKFDSGILDHKKANDTFLNARNASRLSYDRQFQKNLEMMKSMYPSNTYINQMDNADTLYVSSIFYSIARKLENNTALNSEEANIMQQLKRRFTGVPEDSKSLMRLSGISGVLKIFNSILDEKEKIFAERNQSLLSDYQMKISKVLDVIHGDARIRQNNLSEGDLEEIRSKYKGIQKVLESTRIALNGVFEQAANQCTRNVRQIEARVQMASGQYTSFKTDVHTEEREHMYRDGFLWHRKNYYTTTETTYSADTAQIITNISNYIAACNGIVLEEFDHLVNKGDLSRKIKEIVLEAFNHSNEDFLENDILIPLETVLSRIEIPNFSISSNEYIDAIRTEFKSGVVKNDEIHKLSARQAELFIAAAEFTNQELRKCADEITQILKKQAVTFADEISKKISVDGQKLEEQMQNQEKYLAQYAAFLEMITEYRRSLQDIEE